MKVSARYAEEQFADIVHTAMRGEDVEIATPEKPSLRLTLVQSSATLPAGVNVRPLGRLKGLVALPTDEEWAAMDGEIEDLMVDGPLISPGEV